MFSTKSTSDVIKTITTVAENYGFKTYDILSKNPNCQNCTATFTLNTTAKDRRKDNANGLLTKGIHDFSQFKLHELYQPVFAYSIESVPRTGELAISYQVFNVQKSIAEVLLIQSLRALVTELGLPNYTVRINSLGDTDSSARYHRELTNFLRKRIDYLPPLARELMKEHAYLALLHLVEKDHELSYKAPNPLEYLSDMSRKHFREIIEFLDVSQTPYEIDSRLLGHHECYSDAVFQFDICDSDSAEPHPEITIQGGRYDTFTHRHATSKIPVTGAVVVLKTKKAPARKPKRVNHRPSVYLIQLGFGPKLKSILLLDELRQAGIPVQQQLASDSLSEQLREAEQQGAAYAVIMGQKEYVEGSIILRDMTARNQETIPQTELTKYLKRYPTVARS